MSWTTQRGLANRGAASAPTRVGPATIVANWPTGAEVRQVVEFHHPTAGPAALVVAGSCLQAVAWAGDVLWTDFHSTVTKVLHVAASADGPLALVLSRERDVRMVSLVDGSVSWRHQAPAGTNLSGPGSSKLVSDGDALCWLIAPSYAESITCFDITSPARVHTRWSHDFAGRYDRGFGPVMVVADVLGTGEQQVLISSRTGSGYGADTVDGDVPTERVVLGRADGHLYQAVLDLADGRIRAEVAYRPDPGDYPCARPYGLLQVAGTPGDRVAILVSCQVEEFYAATRIAGGMLSRAWGEFVEKDWPVDEQELRPQTSSVAAAGSTRPVLVTGHYHAAGWTTVLRRAHTGEQIGAIPGHYFWGVVAAGDLEFAVVSPANARELAGTEPLRAAPIDDPGRISAGRPLRPVTCGTDILPPEISFHAERRSLLTVVDRYGRVGVLTADADARLCWWDPATDEVRAVADLDVVGGYPGLDGAAVVVDRDGTLHRIDSDLRAAAALAPVGRRPQPLSAVAAGDPWILTPTGSGSTLVHGPAGIRANLPGRVSAVAVEEGALLAATIASDVTLFRCARAGVEEVSAISVAGRPDQAHFLDAPRRLVIAERTGVHTAAIGVHELDGRVVWRDARRGPHPNLVLAAADQHGRWFVAYDDHGVLVLRDAHTGALLGERDWTAAYTTPALIQAAGEDWLLRLGGVHGIEAVSLDLTPRPLTPRSLTPRALPARSQTPQAQTPRALPPRSLSARWRHTTTLWRYYPGEAAVAQRPHGLVMACASAEGALDLLDATTGQVTHTVDLGPLATRPPVIAIDLNDDGFHEFVVGTAAGNLATVNPDTGDIHPWPLSFAAAVEYLAAADTTASGFSNLVVGTADGQVHVVSGRG